jgi:hypothetical protein
MNTNSTATLPAPQLAPQIQKPVPSWLLAESAGGVSEKRTGVSSNSSDAISTRTGPQQSAASFELNFF